MNYIIRRKEKKDCYEIANVVTIAWQETYRGIINDEFLDNLPNTEEERGKKTYDNFNENDNHVFVLEIDNKVVGFIKVGITDDKDYLNCGEIYSIYIIKKYKGNGFGKKLIKKGIEELKKLNCNKMIIGCIKENPSNEFYKHLGGKYIKQRIYRLLNQELIENIYYYESI